MNSVFPYIVIEEPDGSYHLSNYMSITPYTQVILPQLEPIHVPIVQMNILQNPIEDDAALAPHGSLEEPDPTLDRCMAYFSMVTLILFASLALSQIIHSYS